MSQILPIPQIRPEQGAAFGGKAASLARLAAVGLPVPPAVALDVGCLRSFLAFNGLQEAAARAWREGRPEALRSLGRAVEAGRLPPELAGELRRQAGGLGERLVVRSSAVEEDGATRSFAGQFLTVVNVRPGDGLEDAVRRCWASLFDPRVQAYRGRPEGEPGMGVVVQTLVDARVAGVMFTINPVSGSWRELCIEAVFGQGEALVGGQLTPDRVVLRRPRRLWGPLRRVSGRLALAPVELDHVPQARQRVPAAAGELGWAPVPDPDAPKLSPRELGRLGRLGLRAEALGGCPQDLEWALDPAGRLWLLQSRPITAAGAPRRGGEPLWTRRFVGERWLGQATPMGWSIVGGALDWFIAYPETSSALLGGGPPSRLVRGWPTLNATVFRHLAFKLPGLPPPAFMLEFLPPDEVERWTRRFAYPPDLAVYRSILGTTLRERRWRRFRWDPLRNPRAWDAFVVRLEQELPALAQPAADAGGLVAQVERELALLRAYIGVHVISLLMANLLYQVLDGVLPPELRGDLLRSPASNLTVETNIALSRVARGAPLEPFLARYGHRAAHSSWELFTPRWAEDPAQLEPLLAAFREGAVADPEQLALRQAQAARQALAALRERVPGARGAALRGAVRLAQRYLQLREDQRFVFDRLAFQMKRTLLALGARVLPDAALTPWLEWPELRDLALGLRPAEEVAALAARRQRQWQEWARQGPPPEFLLGDAALEVGASGRDLVGLGISAGRATGTVRVLRSPEEGHRLRPGDVLVATATDPGWTPLFSVASAVVLELGSMLSHGAVVAREYGLPAVVNVAGATRRLHDGQLVTVDGGRGRVHVEEEPGG